MGCPPQTKMISYSLFYVYNTWVTEINYENVYKRMKPNFLPVVLTMWSSDNELNLRINEQCMLYFKYSLSLLTMIT